MKVSPSSLLLMVMALMCMFCFVQAGLVCLLGGQLGCEINCYQGTGYFAAHCTEGEYPECVCEYDSPGTDAPPPGTPPPPSAQTPGTPPPPGAQTPGAPPPPGA